MSVQQLTNNNFTLSGKKLIVSGVPEICLVFFKLQTCKGCEAFEPIFYELANSYSKIGYAILNVTMFRNVIDMSRPSSTPITATPTIIMYINGNPYAKYKEGMKKDILSIKQFIDNILIKVNQQRSISFIQQPQAYPQRVNKQPYQTPYTPESFTPQQSKQSFNLPDEEDEKHLMSPESMTPHNTPWDAERKM